MTLLQQVYAQAVMLSGVEEAQTGKLLQIFCRSSINSLIPKLRQGLRPEDCRADFVAAAALYALAALSETEKVSALEQLQVGDLTLKRSGGNAAARALRSQAELIMSPYLQDRFQFRRV